MPESASLRADSFAVRRQLCENVRVCVIEVPIREWIVRVCLCLMFIYSFIHTGEGGLEGEAGWRVGGLRTDFIAHICLRVLLGKYMQRAFISMICIYIQSWNCNFWIWVLS